MQMPHPAATVTLVNHVAVDIARPPAEVWDAIVEAYVYAAKFSAQGYEIEPLDGDPAALLGGYRMRFTQDGAVIDDRICRISERDDAARRLSICADYAPGRPDGMMVYVTYAAHVAEGGARYTIDCHTRIKVEAPAGTTLADAAAELKARFDAALVAYLASVKAKLETPA